MGRNCESLRRYDKRHQEEVSLERGHVRLWGSESVMQPFLNKPKCADLIMTAEQELAAFFHAVMELFGAEQAELSAEEWLHELMASKSLPASTREWRQISIKIAARLALRLNASSAAPISGVSHHPTLGAILSELSAMPEEDPQEQGLYK